MNIEEHLIKMKGGKLYCPVYVRIALFREKCPIHEGWGIVTECIDKDDASAMFSASIIDPQGRVVATGFKREHRAHFADFEEKAGTGAVGRALLFAGFGTQYALDELDEGERIVDAPIPEPRQQTQDASAAGKAFLTAVRRLWGEECGKEEAMSVYRSMYGTDKMTVPNLSGGATRLAMCGTAEQAEAELFVEE